MLFHWKKNRLKEKNFLSKDNNDLIKELKEKGITDKNTLNAMQLVPREIFVDKSFIVYFGCVFEAPAF